MKYIYYLVLAAALLYSFALVDPNLTFFNHPAWTNFRNVMVQLGFYNRPLSWDIYIGIIGLMFVCHIYLVKHFKQFSPIQIACGSAVILLFSYPFLSHDLFNYMFDARILTFHHLNPYLYKALDFPADPWIRFMHWTHRTYPYGPTFLPITLIPSFLGFGKFLPTYILFKAVWAAFYIGATYSLTKIDKRGAMFWATHPLVLMEGLINTHNDLIAVSLALIGIVYLWRSRNWWGRVLIALSGGIKYFTLPLLLLSKPAKKEITLGSIVGITIMGGLILYLAVTNDFQQWYLLNFFALIPLYPKILEKFHILSAGILLSYFEFIRFGGWTLSDINYKVYIALIAVALQVCYFIVRKFYFPKR